MNFSVPLTTQALYEYPSEAAIQGTEECPRAPS